MCVCERERVCVCVCERVIKKVLWHLCEESFKHLYF